MPGICIGCGTPGMACGGIWPPGSPGTPIGDGIPIGAGMPGAGIAVGGIPAPPPGGIPPPGGGGCTPVGVGIPGGIGVRGAGFWTFISACVIASRCWFAPSGGIG